MCTNVWYKLKGIIFFNLITEVKKHWRNSMTAGLIIAFITGFVAGVISIAIGYLIGYQHGFDTALRDK